MIKTSRVNQNTVDVIQYEGNGVQKKIGIISSVDCKHWFYVNLNITSVIDAGELRAIADHIELLNND